MSGHSKWSTIKHKKAATDAKRGKIFSKIAREIVMCARQGGGDPAANITLRALIQKARSVNMPADNIDRAIKKGTGEIEGETLEEMIYEGYAPGGVAVLIAVLTDNKNRTAAEIRHAFTKHNASQAGQGAVGRLFHRKGQILVLRDAVEEDRLMEVALEAGAEDMLPEGEGFEIITDPADFMNVVEALEKAEIPIEASEVTMMPENTVPVTDRAQAAGILRFIEFLEDNDDVQSVYANHEISEELMEELGA